jgi:hypothetical protein
LDADGDLDALISGSDRHQIPVLSGQRSRVEVLLNRGDGVFGRSVVLPVGSWAGPLITGDLNGDDKVDIAVMQQLSVTVVVALNEAPGELPEEPAPCWSGEFRRGDVASDSDIDPSDAIAILAHLFLGIGDEVTCLDAADTDDDGRVTISDAIFLLYFLWLEPGPVPPPYPECGPDPTPDDLGCAEQPPACR